MNKFITVILLLVSSQLYSQTLTATQYIERYKDVAINEMRRSGIPAAITLAQGLLESESGNGLLTVRSNNHFGIKCKSNWTGETVYHDDDERGECFRKYPNSEDSYRDHTDFLKNSVRYADLFSLDPMNYKGWAYGLKKAGYATNPRYPQILMGFIEKYNLQQYTLSGISSKDYDNVASADKSDYNINPSSSELGNENEMNKTNRFGLKAVHVSEGTSLLAVASAFDIPLYKLVEFNDLSSEGILTKDQWLYLEKKNKSSETVNHIALPGETLYDISQCYGIQLSFLFSYNNLDKDITPTTGKIIYLQPRNNDIVKEIIHEVKPKESLYSISKKYDVSINHLKDLNNLSTDNLTVGQRIIISNK